MKRRAPYRAITLAIYPNTHGFGWAAFTGPFSLYDWGSVGAKGRGKNEMCLRRVERLLSRFTPQVVVLEAFEHAGSKRRPRIIRLCRAIVTLAVDHGADVAIYPFREVRAQFLHVGASTRCEIAAMIGRQFAALARLVPRARKAWEPEHWRISLFNAVALILTHFQRDAGRFLTELSA